LATASRQPLIAARTSSERKAQFAALAASRGLSESALLTAVVDAVLGRNPVTNSSDADSADRSPSSDRITLRLRPGDRALLDARAAQRGMKPATYLVALVRAHVRCSAPLPAAELNALKLAVAELSSLARHLHRMTGFDDPPDSNVALGQHLCEVTARVEDARRLVADVVRTNLMSWEIADA